MKQIQTIVTPDGPMAIIRQTAEKLLKEGVISGTLDGELHAKDAATVKAALMAAAVCDFCSAPGAVHFFDVPDFGITTDSRGGTNYSQMVGSSTGGWMACDVCNELIVANKRKQLVDRALAIHAFPKFSRRAVEELYAKFWQGMDERKAAACLAMFIADVIEDRLPEDAYTTKARPHVGRDKRIESAMRNFSLSRSEIDLLLKGNLSREIVVKLGKAAEEEMNLRQIRQLVEDQPQKPLADVTPHWQRALDAKFAALSSLSELLRLQQDVQYFPQSTTDLNDPSAVKVLLKQADARKKMETLKEMGFGEDAKLLRAAEAYSFNAETIAAIREAAQGIPRDAPLSSIETPNTGAGWFWFSEPLPVTASPIAADRTHALLWGWTEGDRHYKVNLDEEFMKRVDPALVEELKEAWSGQERDRVKIDFDLLKKIMSSAKVTQEEYDRVVEPFSRTAIMFSVYVVDENKKMAWGKPGTPYPSTRWYWPLEQSFADMLAFNAEKWDESYGPGGPYYGDANIIGKEATLTCISELSLFFVMSCLWFKQTVPILTREPGHVERHARKRLQREHKLDKPPSVQVIALRKSQRTAAADALAERQEGTREYHCRWIVKGHPRLQPCGPGRKDKKLIWIEAHPAGPDDKPLRTRDKVYAVIR